MMRCGKPDDRRVWREGLNVGALRTRRWPLLLVVFTAVSAGCNRQDTECLARIGHKTVGRAGALTGDFRDSLTHGLQGVSASVDETGMEGRVVARLRWDRSLADRRIDVKLKE